MFSAAVAVAGVIVGLMADAPEMRYFGWFLAVIGALALFGNLVLRGGRRR